MPGSRVNMSGFDGGLQFEDEQKFALGTIGQDRLGQRWSYVQLTGDVALGQWVGDIARISRNSVAGGVPQWGDIVRVTTNFDADYSPVGGFGYVTEGAGQQAGQGFIVTEQIADDTVRIQLINSSTKRLDGGRGFEAAVDVASDIVFMFPGVVEVGTGARVDSARGVAQVAGTDEQFGWVQQSGIGIIALAGGAVIGADGEANFAASGVFTNTAGTAGARVLQGAVAAAQRGLNPRVLAEIDIVNTARQWIGGGPPARAIGTGPEAIR